MSPTRFSSWILLLATALVAGHATLGQEEGTPEEPSKLGLTEKAAAALVQLDVTVTGPDKAIQDLGRADFELRVGGRFIENFIVDRVCREFGVEAITAESTPVPAEGEPPVEPLPASLRPPSPATYVLFFDMPHLTMSGYNRSFELAQEVIEDLFPGNAQGKIVSNAREMIVVTAMTADPNELLAGLRRLQRNRRQYHTYAMEEESRIEDVLADLSEDTDRGLATARRYLSEEIWYAQKSLHRVSMVLGSLSEMDPPKAFLYFADTLRSNSGEHYLSYFASAVKGVLDEEAEFLVSTLNSTADLGALTLDGVVDDASAVGVRFYTIEARGLTGAPLLLGGRTKRGGGAGVKNDDVPGDTTNGGGLGTSLSLAGNSVALIHAQDTLGAMAHETGGRRFINGVRGKKIAQAIKDDLSCLYLISFDPADLPLNEPIPVRLTPTRPKVRIQTRGRLVIQSESARRTMRLLAAFATSTDQDAKYPIAGRVIPTGYVGGKYHALVQVSIPPTQLVNATWDVGASLVSRGKVREDGSGQVRTPNPGVPVVFEDEMRIPPGPFELAVVAHETTTDQVLSRRIEGELPDPDDAPVTIPPVALLQPEAAAFLRGERLKKSGVLALGEIDTVQTDRPTAIVGLVCRAKFNKRTLTVTRTLTGDSTAEFGSLELTADAERCAQFRDLMPAGTMTQGGFQYDVRVFEGDTEVAHRSTEFFALEPES